MTKYNALTTAQQQVTTRASLPPSCGNLIFRILRYHIRATGALYGSGVNLSSSTGALLTRAFFALDSTIGGQKSLISPNFTPEGSFYTLKIRPSIIHKFP